MEMLLSSLSTEIILNIAACLTPKDALSLSCTSRTLSIFMAEHMNLLAKSYRISTYSSLNDGIADVTFWFEHSNTCLVLEWTMLRDQLSTFKRLINISTIDLIREDAYGLTLMHRVSSQGLVLYMELLMSKMRDRGINPFQADSSRRTPLHYAAGRGMKAAVNLLLASGAIPDAKDNHGNTPLHLAAVNGSASSRTPDCCRRISRFQDSVWMVSDQSGKYFWTPEGST
jgi:ankyrin repeat protein